MDAADHLYCMQARENSWIHVRAAQKLYRYIRKHACKCMSKTRTHESKTYWLSKLAIILRAKVEMRPKHNLSQQTSTATACIPLRTPIKKSTR